MIIPSGFSFCVDDGTAELHFNPLDLTAKRRILTLLECPADPALCTVVVNVFVEGLTAENGYNKLQGLGDDSDGKTGDLFTDREAWRPEEGGCSK